MTDDSLDLFEVTFWNDLKEFADDVGITHKKASKLLRKFKEIEKKRSRSKARQSRGVDEENILWDQFSILYTLNPFSIFLAYR